jgi:LmbE family N-acetylglucosaminyl deacetylase
MLRSHGRAAAAWLPALVVALAPAVTAAAAAAVPAAVHAPAQAPGLPHLDAATSLLVVAPHPDDETLCCAGVIQRVLAAGGRAGIVWVTSGDGSRLDQLFVVKSLIPRPAAQRELAARRAREARAAATQLGVPAGAQLFLGYPDGGVAALLGDYYMRPYTSRFTAAAAVPYADALFPGHPYTGASLEQDLEAVLERLRPTLVLAPSPKDAHADHRATGLLVLRIMASRGELAALRLWIVHGGEGWPAPRGLSPGLPLPRAPRMADAPLAAVELTPGEEDRKLAALRLYATQMQVLSPFLLAFVRTTELFAAPP